MPTRNTRRALLTLSLLVFPAGVLLWGFLGAVVNPALAFLALPWVYLMAHLYKSIGRCPRCGRSAGWRRYRVLGQEFDGGWPFVPRHCEHCGYDLTGKGGETRESQRS
jgi:hypothetical protein